MTYGSVCSGIEAASVAWHPLGWEPTWFAEIDRFPRAVLAHRWPGVPDLGDFTKIGANHGPVDLLVGGTPCQSFSIAGLRQGLDDPRGNLMLEFGALARRVRARWLVWENVPGVLSSNGGRDFGTFLGMLAELGYGFAYRVLDAQFYGVAQQRRRVFVVGHAGGLWQRAAAVLFEPESLRGDPAPRREARKGTAAFTPGSLGGYREGVGTLRAWGGDLGGGSETLVAASLNANGKAAGSATQQDAESGLLVLAPSLTASSRSPQSQEITQQVAAVLAAETARSLNAHPSRSDWETETLIPEPFAFSNGGGDAVRRLTPRECERLQGFHDDYTAIPGAKDGPRYKALGNSMAVPVMRWIGERIQMVEDATKGER
jgi:DNA (cytosine-5)-methyltransferase 1